MALTPLAKTFKAWNDNTSTKKGDHCHLFFALFLYNFFVYLLCFFMIECIPRIEREDLNTSLAHFAKKSIILAFALLPTMGFAVDFPTAGNANAGTTARAGQPSGTQLFSQYGQIQNVQSYSSNPFFNKDSPYNQRLPVPVYVTGTELTAAECRAAVASVVAMQCSMQNNCNGMRVQDIRPYVVQSLATLPGHNYVTACGGYIDTVFEDYMKQSQNLGTGTVAFPTTTNAPNTEREFKIDNPYEPQMPTFKKEIFGRIVELDTLQKQNADDTKLVATQMPKTFEDLSFTERNAILADGYAEWKCDPATGRGCTYRPVKIETDLERYTREANEATEKQAAMEAKAKMEESRVKIEKSQDYCAWCKKDANKNACYMELTKTATEENNKIKNTACSAGQTRAKLWRITDSVNCNYELTLSPTEETINCGQTPQQKNNDNGTNPNGTTPVDPCASRGAVTDTTCTVVAPNKDLGGCVAVNCRCPNTTFPENGMCKYDNNSGSEYIIDI